MAGNIATRAAAQQQSGGAEQRSGEASGAAQACPAQPWCVHDSASGAASAPTLAAPAAPPCRACGRRTPGGEPRCGQAGGRAGGQVGGQGERAGWRGREPTKLGHQLHLGGRTRRVTAPRSRHTHCCCCCCRPAAPGLLQGHDRRHVRPQLAARHQLCHRRHVGPGVHHHHLVAGAQAQQRAQLAAGRAGQGGVGGGRQLLLGQGSPGTGPSAAGGSSPGQRAHEAAQPGTAAAGAAAAAHPCSAGHSANCAYRLTNVPPRASTCGGRAARREARVAAHRPATRGVRSGGVPLPSASASQAVARSATRPRRRRHSRSPRHPWRPPAGCAARSRPPPCRSPRAPAGRPAPPQTCVGVHIGCMPCVVSMWDACHVAAPAARYADCRLAASCR